MDVRLEPSWKKVLAPEFQKPYFTSLREQVRAAYCGNDTVYPPPQHIFRAFELCPFSDVKVVILGQDPYHGRGQAQGLCFSVSSDVPVPPSLQNVYKELHNDLGVPIPPHGDLTHWAEQGVLLLNATLTVSAGKPGSHQGLGWETFTDAVIEALSEGKEHLVFLLWGRYAQAKGVHIDTAKHLVLTAAHPSPFSAYSGFFGCKHFSKTNAYLVAHGNTPIQW